MDEYLLDNINALGYDLQDLKTMIEKQDYNGAIDWLEDIANTCNDLANYIHFNK